MIFCPDTIASTVGFSRSKRRTLLCSLPHTMKAGGATLAFLITSGQLPHPLYLNPSPHSLAPNLLLMLHLRHVQNQSSPFLSSSVQALMGFKVSIEDPYNVLENWDQISVASCSWTMITCLSQNLVIWL
ncbi:hypothetical protein ZIOFF_072827 [Zingiber officinale]|uniref:Leucine-rich repeat-containing N-terminal plant-type domain-containing protein n=1 Tax=Zingiber officinale TaxID=94328 RepID=A0A8J5ESF6_ZINOF|nr:hypothetical protein ZIOFF_072827 [Zingiber officinale]